MMKNNNNEKLRQLALRQAKRIQEARRENGRIKDVERLLAERKKWFNKFMWDSRYDPRYVLGYARANGWVPARLVNAIGWIDAQERMEKARQLTESVRQQVKTQEA